MFIDERRKMILKCIADEGRVRSMNRLKPSEFQSDDHKTGFEAVGAKGFLTRT